MFQNAIKYELKRSLVPFAALYAIAILFSLLARMRFFSLTDMPLFYLVFFGAVVILLFRFWHTMFGQEATFLFSIPLKAKGQVGVRLICAVIFSVITTLLIAAAILIQGESMSSLLLELNSLGSVLLFSGIVISLFSMVLQLETALTLSSLPICRQNRTLWIVIWAVVLFGVTTVLSSLSANFIDQYIIISQTGSVSLGNVHTTPLSFSFSLNQSLWTVIVSPVCIWLITYITKKYLSIA